MHDKPPVSPSHPEPPPGSTPYTTRLLAITERCLVVSGLPHGGDIGVESADFVPPGFSANDAAYLADRFSRGSRHPGTDSILRLPGQELIAQACAQVTW